MRKRQPEILTLAHPRVDVLVRRSVRGRRMSLRVSRLDGRVVLSLPQRVPLREGEAFLRARADWIAVQLDGLDAPRPVQTGGQILLRGAPCAIICDAALRGAPQLRQGALHVPKGRRVGPMVQAWLREEARAALVQESQRYAQMIGQNFSKITLRDTRSRWGSCSSHGALMYSWRLVMAPSAVLSYVAAHEVAHLQEMNHSAAFWDVVERMMPEWQEHRNWLRLNGASLHAYRFED